MLDPRRRKIVRDTSVYRCRVFFGNLPECTPEELASICMPHGNVTGAVVEKNLGYTQFETEEIALNAATALMNSAFKGKTMTVRHISIQNSPSIYDASEASNSETMHTPQNDSSVQAPKKVPFVCNDCEIIVVDRKNTHYAEMIEQSLFHLNIRIDILYPNQNVTLGKVLSSIAARGCLYAILITNQHEEHNSVTVNILHGQPAEHRNMPANDAIKLITNDYYTKILKKPSPMIPAMISNIPSMPALLTAPAAPTISAIPAAPSISAILAAPSISAIPAAPSISAIPAAPSIPAIPVIPAALATPATSAIPAKSVAASTCELPATIHNYTQPISKKRKVDKSKHLVPPLTERHPHFIQSLLNLLATNKQLTVAQYDLIINYLSDRRSLQEEIELGDVNKISQTINVNPANNKMKKNLLRMLYKPSVLHRQIKPAYANISAARADKPLVELLRDPRVQRALNMLLNTSAAHYVENIIELRRSARHKN